MDSSISLELVFNEAEFQVLVPNCSSDDYKDILSSKPRSFTFFDEQLKVYLLARVPYQISGTGDDVRDTIRSFFNQLDVHVEASNLDGSSAQPPTASPFSPSLQHRSLSTKLTSSAPSSPKMHHKRENSRGPFTATTATAPESLPFFSQTFNTRGNDAEPIFYEQDEAYCCLYPFIIPILYVKTRSTNPLISITYNISYRPMPQSTKKKDDDYDDDEKDDFDNDAFETIDLLSGLAEDPVFSSVENSLHQRFVVEKHSRQPSGSFGSNSPSSSQMLTLRRHVRETLCVRSGLNVKMRTTNASVVDKMVMMSVELENTVDAGCEFIVDKVDVMVSNSVVTMTSAKQVTFPINLKTMDQMVLLYNVTLLEDGSAKPPTQPTRIFPTRNRPALPSLPPIPPQDDRLQPQRVSIQVYGSSVIDGIRTLPMRSKWNTMLDVSGMRQKREEHDPRFSSLLNSSGGSGGPSYLTRSSASKSTSVSASPGARSVGSPMSQIAYSDGMTAAAAGGKKRMVLATAARDGGGPGAAAAAAARRTEMEVADGIIISFTVPSTIVVGKVFLLKIFIVNRSKHTRRFLVMVPNRKRQHQPPPAPDVKSNLPPLPIEQQPVEPYMDEAEFLRQYFENETHEADILCLENNVRLSPLGPSTSQSVDIRFIAVKENLHTIDLIQLVDQDTGFVTNLRQVLEIFVNPRPIE